MKKTRIQKMLSFALAMMVALTMIISSTVGAFAAPKYDVGAPSIMYQGQENYNVSVYKIGVWKNITPTKVSSSKPGIVKVQKETWEDIKGKKHTDYWISAKKVGKSTLTVKFKVKGKVKTLKHKVTVKKYPKPIKSLKVNNKKVTLSGKNRYRCNVTNKATTAKIKMALNKGWKITYVYGRYSNYNTGKEADYKDEKKLKKLIKNGKAINFPKKWTNLGVGINMTKGNQDIHYWVSFER